MTDPVNPVAPREEWLERYKRRFIEIAGVTPAQAEILAEEPFDQISEFFEDDPEGAADEEMSCWEAE